jgi:hypothetical protein
MGKVIVYKKLYLFGIILFLIVVIIVNNKEVNKEPLLYEMNTYMNKKIVESYKNKNADQIMEFVKGPFWDDFEFEKIEIMGKAHRSLQIVKYDTDQYSVRFQFWNHELSEINYVLPNEEVESLIMAFIYFGNDRLIEGFRKYKE